MNKFMLIVLACTSLTGCISLAEHIDQGGCTDGYYDGTKKAVKIGTLVPPFFLDVPFSAVMDTILLPVDAFCHI
ncbi:YceK/YidQ family lipoprotein [Rahnella bruchi]|uniref:YceK/YidQ family lipoprotein n=1 Tax=Rahnella bruchi TaxID=1510573 RepID=UPI000EA2CD07|nr:YceK/YidQ family lipoprotein [Rahnella bruchi]